MMRPQKTLTMGSPVAGLLQLRQVRPFALQILLKALAPTLKG